MRRVEEELVTGLARRGYPVTWRAPWVLTLVAGRKVAIRCRYYESKTDPGYLAAATNAAELGFIGAGRVVTFDESRGDVRFYTVHVAPRGRLGRHKIALRIRNG